MHGLSTPHLVATAQQMQLGHCDDELTGILLNQSPLDLGDLRTHRATECSATGVIEIQPNDCPGLRYGPSGGLQCVATHQKEGQSCYSNP
jgi:hypothetical protein